MILTASSVEKHASGNTVVKTRLVGRHNDWFVPALYKNELKRTWAMGLLFAVILFFAIPVFNLMILTNEDSYYTRYPERAADWIAEYFATSNPIMPIYALIGGVFCAMIVAEYLYDRRKTNFVCSLPIKRQAYLITKAAANLTWSMLAWLPAILLMISIALISEHMRPHFGTILGGCFILFGTWLCMHLYFFGLTMLSCCFCGTGVMGSCMLLMLGGYVPIAAVSLIGLVEMAFSYVDTNFYMSSDFFSAISGVFRILSRTPYPKSGLFLTGCVLLGILFFAGAVWLTVIRQSEKAGTPFAFDRVRDLVKYLVMGLSAILGGMLFHALSGGHWMIFWMLFGVVCASVISWMLCNTIFYKTPKMMFEGKRGMAVLTAVFMVFSLLIRFDVLKLDTYVPSNVMTNKIEIQLHNNVIEIKDKQLIRTYNAMVRNGYKYMEQYGWGAVGIQPTYEKNSSFPDLTRDVVTVWGTNYLVPVAKNTYALYSDWAAFVRALTAREDFADLYFANTLEKVTALEKGDYTDDTIYTWYQTHGSIAAGGGYEISNHLTADAVREILETYREEMRTMGADAMQQHYHGMLNMRLDDSYVFIPVFSCYEETLEKIIALVGNTNGNHSETSVYSYERTFISADIYKNGTIIGSLTEEEFNAMLTDGTLIDDVDIYDYQMPLTLIDPDYGVRVSYNVKENRQYFYYEEDGTPNIHMDAIPAVDADMELSEEEAKNLYNTDTEEYVEVIICGFFWDQVPAEIMQ